MRSPLAFTFGLFVASPALASSFTGEFWDHDAGIGTLTDAFAVIAAGPADVTFATPAIDFPLGAEEAALDTTPLADFLGVPGAGAQELDQSVFRFTGLIDLEPGPQTFTVGSDDGFQLVVDSAEVASFSFNRGFSETSVTIDAGAGPTPFTLIYYENLGGTGVEFRIDGALATPADVRSVPLSPTAPLLLAALAGFGALRRRRP